MSKLTLILLAGTLISCGGKEKKEDIPLTPEAQHEALGKEQLQVGLRSITQSEGHHYVFENDEMARDYLVVKKKIDKTEDAVILKVEGNKYYSYIRTEDRTTHTTSVRIQLQSLNLQETEGRISGSTLTYAGETSMNASGNKKSFTRRYQFEHTLNMNALLCDYKRNEKDLENIFTNNGSSQKLSNLEAKIESQCDGMASVEELRALNLTSIEYCETMGKCVPSQNMDHLKP